MPADGIIGTEKTTLPPFTESYRKRSQGHKHHNHPDPLLSETPTTTVRPIRSEITMQFSHAMIDSLRASRQQTTPQNPSHLVWRSHCTRKTARNPMIAVVVVVFVCLSVYLFVRRARVCVGVRFSAGLGWVLGSTAGHTRCDMVSLCVACVWGGSMWPATCVAACYTVLRHVHNHLRFRH